MNLRVLLILFLFIILCLTGLWWYHDQVICNCVSPAVLSEPKKDSIPDTTKKIVDTLKPKISADSTTSIMKEGKLVVYFPVNSVKNNPDKITIQRIEDLAKSVKGNGKIILITGHSDSQGKPEQNMELGLKRANKLKDLMIEHGANSNQIKTISKGQTEPISTNDTPEGRALNRRAEVILQN